MLLALLYHRNAAARMKKIVDAYKYVRMEKPEALSFLPIIE